MLLSKAKLKKNKVQQVLLNFCSIKNQFHIALSLSWCCLFSTPQSFFSAFTPQSGAYTVMDAPAAVVTIFASVLWRPWSFKFRNRVNSSPSLSFVPLVSYSYRLVRTIYLCDFVCVYYLLPLFFFCHLLFAFDFFLLIWTLFIFLLIFDCSDASYLSTRWCTRRAASSRF